MIAMRPIQEPEVVDSLNQGRFPGEVRGYVVMDGPEYLGHLLFSVKDDITTVLECGLPQQALVDGGVRACVAAGENAGATRFCVNENDAVLTKWFGVFLKGESAPVPNEKLFHSCK